LGLQPRLRKQSKHNPTKYGEVSSSSYSYPVEVYDIVPDPEIIRNGGTCFEVVCHYFSDRDPEGLWDGSFYWIEVKVYDLTGRQVASVACENCTEVWWSGDELRNGAYIYRATVKDTWLGDLVTFGPFQGFVYISR